MVIEGHKELGALNKVVYNIGNGTRLKIDKIRTINWKMQKVT